MRSLAAIAIATCTITTTPTARAECAGNLALSAGAGVVAGATASLISAGIISETDSSSGFEFGVGAGVGIGVTAGLSLIYVIVDGSSDCRMTDEQGGFAWTVPVVTGIVGALLPIGVWAAENRRTTFRGLPPMEQMEMQGFSVSIAFE